MGMYPAYKLDDVLNEYAVSFFTLLSEGYKIQAHRDLMATHIASVPLMDSVGRDTFIRNMEWATKDPDDILGLNDSTGTIDDLRKMLDTPQP